MSKLPLFEFLRRETLVRLAARMDPLTKYPAENITNSGQDSDSLFILEVNILLYSILYFAALCICRMELSNWDLKDNHQLIVQHLMYLEFLPSCLHHLKRKSEVQI